MPQPGRTFYQDSTEDWMIEAGKLFPQGENNLLVWPAAANMVCEKHQILYTPIAKCACTSLKTMMARLAELPHCDAVLRMGIHRVTDRFNTGLQLKDLPMARAMEITHSGDYFKFAVIREPVRRIVSSYTEKFLSNRLRPNNQFHTGRVVRSIQDSSKPDMDRGVSFREFVNYIISQPPEALDPHWGPQYLMLGTVPHYDRIFRVDQLAELEAVLEQRTGVTVELKKLNATVPDGHSGETPDATPGEIVDLLPNQLDGQQDLNAELFMAPDLVADLEQYYARDCAIYRDTFDPDSQYQSTFNEAGMTAWAGRDAREEELLLCWNKIHIYSKGFFGLQPDGVGSTSIALVNNNPLEVTFPSLRLQISILDAENNVLSAEPAVHPVSEALPSAGNLQISLEATVPANLRSQAAKLQIDLVTSSQGGVLRNAIAHVAWAEIVPQETGKGTSSP